MWVLEGNYQGERNFTFEGLTAAKNRRLTWRNKIAAARQSKGTLLFDDAEFKIALLNELNQNLNSAAAFAVVDQNDLLSPAAAKILDDLFGLNPLADSPDLPAPAKTLIEKREQARKSKDWATADQLRNQLLEFNLVVKDTPDGPLWQYAS